MSDYTSIPRSIGKRIGNAVKAHERGLLATGGREPGRVPQVLPVIRVWNNSGSDQTVNAVLGIDSPAWTPSEDAAEQKLFLYRDGLICSEPDPDDHLGKWVVLAEPIPADGNGLAWVHGVAKVRVYVNGVDDGYCDVVEAETVGEGDEAETCYLGTGATGAQILWRENAGSGAGTVVWAIVRIGGDPGPRFYNASGEEAPANAIMAVSGVQTLAGGEVVKKIIKPTTATFYREYIVNGSAPVANGATGVYQEGPEVEVAYDTGTPAVGEGWGPKPGQWTVSKNYPETCRIAGVTDSTNKIVLANLHIIDEVIGKLDGALAQGGSQTVSIWSGAGGSEADTGVNLTAYDWLMKSGASDIASGKKVFVHWINGVPYAVEAECP